MDKCKKCNADLEKKYQFCPNCSTPLTASAELLKKEERRGAMLDALMALTENIKDPESLKVIGSLVTKIKKS